MKYVFITLILFIATSVQSQSVETIVGKWKLIELREVKEPLLSQARNRNPNAKIWYLDDETLPNLYQISSNNFFEIIENRENLNVIGFSGCNKFKVDIDIKSNMISFESFKQMGFLQCESANYESNYFEMLNDGYNSSYKYKIIGKKLYFYIDKNDSRYTNLRILTFSNKSLKVINNFFDTPFAIFESIN